MKTRIYFSLLLFIYLALGNGSLLAQANVCAPGKVETLEINKIRAPYSNGADMYWDFVNQPGFEVPKTNVQADKRFSAFASAFWMGGVDGTGQLHVAANTYRQSGNDFFPGPIPANGNFRCDSVINIQNLPVAPSLTVSPRKTLIFIPGGVLAFDEATHQYTSHAFSHATSAYEPLLMTNGDIILLNGPNATLAMKNEVSILDTATLTDSPLDTLQLNHTFSTMTEVAGGEILFAGPNGCELYNPATQNSQIVGSFVTSRHYSSAVRLKDGRIFSVGGSSAPNGVGGLGVTEFFDPISQTWTSGPQMSIGRKIPSLFRLPGGKVLIAGGSPGADGLEVFDPQTNTITLATVLGTGVNISYHMELLQSGDVIYGKSGNFTLIDTSSFQVQPLQTTSKGWFGLLPSGCILTGDSLQRILIPEQDRFKYARWQDIWHISRAQIDQFKADFAAGTLNFAAYDDIYWYPGNGNPAYGEDYQLAPFVDVNQDGRYDPKNDGDYPCLPGDDNLWWIFNDAAETHGETGGLPLGVQAEATAWALDCSNGNCADSSLDYTQFIHLEIVNKSPNSYTDFYFGMWMDSDIGNFADDYVGCDTNLNLGFTFNGDPDDQGPDGYGLNPPAIGIKVLQDPAGQGMAHFHTYQNDFSTTGNPEFPHQYYDYLRSVWKDGSQVVDNNLDGYPGTMNGPAANYLFPGDGGFCGGTPTGWSEVSASNNPFDRRMLVSTGPVNLAAGDTLVYDLAIIWARGFFNDNKGSVCRLKDYAGNVQAWFDSTSHSCFNLTVQREEAIAPAKNGLLIYPNPGQDLFNLRSEVPFGREAKLDLIDLQGRVLHSEALVSGTTTHQLHLSHLSKGTYLLKIQNGTSFSLEKLIIH